MINNSTEVLGTKSIGSLLLQQAIPASIGILVMSLNVLVDSIFVGNWIGPLAMAAINVVLPVSFFIAAIGMAIGVGGSSVLSRALGANKYDKAVRVFGNQISLTLLITISLVVIGLLNTDYLVNTFGGRGGIFNYAKEYYQIILYGVPILALNMMGNNVIRAEGKPKFAMFAMIIPSVTNLFLDYIFINVMGKGMVGAGWASTISYILCFSYIFYYFLKHSSLHLRANSLILKLDIITEIGSLSLTTLTRQGIISVVYLILNNIVIDLSGEWAVTSYAIVSRLLMFMLFPIIGVTQGFLPIASFNYGAENYDRVIQVIKTAIAYASVLGLVIFSFIMLFPELITQLFLSNKGNVQSLINEKVLKETPTAIRLVFCMVPIISLQLIGSAYFQAVGKALPAFLLTLTRQGFFLIPCLFILPKYFGLMGVWLSFAVSDLLSTIITAYFLNREIKVNLQQMIEN